jgi:hypothetical protein
MYYKDFFIAALGLYSCLIAVEASANYISNVKVSPISNLLASFSPFSSLHSLPPSFPSMSQSPSSHPATNSSNGLSTEREACRKIPQDGKAKFCEGQVLAKYNRRDEAREFLILARDTFLKNGKPDKAKEVEDWTAQNGISLVPIQNR